ncbi:hypothetical protein Hypma_015999 [Hypsizygus marmoreus]|uniref:Uncharacterized protein n=1 Tax=Hypsizygus marmoreus TaxID=39966 RepID=A0A369K6B1_HYPMA|nr:hypothetical protein Hypma_015999 [Hypsizygus marmoreus]
MTTTSSSVDFGTGGQDVIRNDNDTTRQEKSSSRSPPHSLIISPNLDALLEFDEKVRGALGPGSPTRDLPQSAPLVATFPMGLPPPPRRNRNNAKPRSPTSPKVGSPLAREAGSPISVEAMSSNPYINPAPSLEVVQSMGGLEHMPRDEISPQTADGGSSPHIRSSSRSSVDLTVQPSNAAWPSTISHPTKNRVDKLLSIGKIPFGLFLDASSPKTEKPELNDVSNSPVRVASRSQPALNLRERARAKGKLLKLNNNLSDSNHPPEMLQLDDQTVLDIRRRQSTDGAWTPPDSDDEREPDIAFPRRPLLSHDPWLPSSSRSSSVSSSSSATTQGPASTLDHRISVSSTIYPASSAHSHPHDMYQTVDPVPIIPPHRTSSLHQPSPIEMSSSKNTDRQSFIDIVSPAVADFDLPNLHDYRLTSSQPPSRTSSPKPPIPTVPKPIFNRPSSKTSPLQRHKEPKQSSADSLPPTTNFLDLDERSDLIRKNRKLARVFGQLPGPDAFSQQEAARFNKPPVLPGLSVGRHQRGAMSMSNNLDIAAVTLPSPQSVWPPAGPSGRRHSAPLSPDDFSFLNTGKGESSSEADKHATDGIRPSSPTSFIDLSDDPGSATPKKKVGRPPSPSSQSIFESMSPEEQAEEVRRRKREKLAKLHRFLGSRVPAGLVLGLEDVEASLPPPDNTMLASTESEEGTKKAWLRRRRSSSVIAYSSSWSDEVDRLKEDLNEREKAINVRRAHKMEKVFGVAPPQTLYHTRRSPSPSVGNAVPVTSHKMVSGWMSPGEAFMPVTGQRNPNRSSYTKPKSKKEHRPGTSESGQQLLPKGRSESVDVDSAVRKRTSIIYSHYQESLNSLNDIIDRDDRASLAELHEYLHHGDMTIPPPLQSFTRSPTGDRRLSTASATKSERRRSLPARTSIMSISSEYSVSTPRPDVTDFQARRRRAAKLTQFFGVDYRELITDVLESIEHGLEHERKRGTLNPDEVEDLLARLRNLRTKREGVF